MADPGAGQRGVDLRRLLVAQALQTAGSSGVAVVLVLFLTRPGVGGGASIGLSPAEAAAWYGVYFSLTFLTAIPGAWLADHRLGAGGGYAAGITLALVGQVWLALDPRAWLAALLVLALAGGMVKPTAVTLATRTTAARAGGAHAALTRLTAARALGRLLGALGMGVAEVRLGWPAAFGLCAAFSIMALVVLMAGPGASWREFLAAPAPRVDGRQADGDLPGEEAAMALDDPAMPRVEVGTARGAGVAVMGVLLLIGVGHLGPGLDGFGATAALGMALATVLLAVVLQRRFLHAAPDPGERARRSGYTAVLFLAGLFWVSASMTGSVLNLFIDRHTDRVVAGFTVPTTWLQIVGPVTMLAVTPMLTRRGSDGRPLWVRAPRSLAVAMCALAVAFALVLPGALAVAGGRTSALAWPVAALAGVALAAMLLGPTGQAIAASIPATSSRAVALWYVALAAGIALGGLAARSVPALGFSGYFAAAGGLALVGAVTSVLLRTRIRAAAGGDPRPRTAGHR